MWEREDEHLKTTKKIRQRGSDGDMVERFVKTDDNDHWVHALNYATVASMAVEDLGISEVIGSLPSIGKVKVGSNTSGSKTFSRVGW